MYVMGCDLGLGNYKEASGHRGGALEMRMWPACTVPVESLGISLYGGDDKSERRIDVGGRMWAVGVSLDSGARGAEEMHAGYVGSAPWLAQLGYALRHRGRVDRLVLGLPVDEWSIPQNHELTKSSAAEAARLSGTQLAEVLVVPQPLGAYVDANVRKSGGLMKQRVLVVDPGRYTVDWTLFVKGKLQPDGSGSDRRGAVSRIIEGVQQHLWHDARARIDEGRIREALDSGLTEIMVKGKQVECGDAIAGITSRVVDEALLEIRRTLRIESDVDTVLLTGGGSKYYRARLMEVFGEGLVQEVPEPVMANARGYWWYGAHAA